MQGEPVSYDYSQYVVDDNGTVYDGDQPLATTEQIYTEASDLATSGAQTVDDEWLPLGVFAIVTEGQSKGDKTLQLAVNREGVIRGNLYDQLTDQALSVEGSVDRETQLAAFRLTDKPSIVAEVGLWNLTQDSLSILVYLEPGRSENRILIRLQDPDQQEN